MGRDEEAVAGLVRERGQTDEAVPEPVTQGAPLDREAELAGAVETTPSAGSFRICSSCPQLPITHRCEGCTKAASRALSGIRPPGDPRVWLPCAPERRLALPV